MNKSHFDRDVKNEEILTEWIEANFLSIYSNQYDIIQDSKIQKTGVDFILNSKKIFKYDLPYKVDFKAALTYTKPIKDDNGNKPSKMPTFAFELSFLNPDKQEREGWLFGNNYSNTEYYMVAWVWADLPNKDSGNFIRANMDNFNYENIEEVEVMIIKKSKLQNYARRYGIDRESAHIYSQSMRNKNKKYTYLNKYGNFPRLHYTSFLNEEPVNLVIHNDDLKEMAIFQHTIIKRTEKKEENIDNKQTLSKSVNKTCDLFNQGNSIEQIVVKRKINIYAILSHLLTGAKSGVLKPTSFNLSSNKKRAIKKAIDKLGDGKLAPLKEELDNKLGQNFIDYRDIKLYLIELHTNEFK